MNWSKEQIETKEVYYNIMNDSETISKYYDTSLENFLAWESYGWRNYYLEEVCEYLQVGPYALKR